MELSTLVTAIPLSVPLPKSPIIEPAKLATVAPKFNASSLIVGRFTDPPLRVGTSLTMIWAFCVPLLNAVELPNAKTAAVAPAVPVVSSQARKVSDGMIAVAEVSV